MIGSHIKTLKENILEWLLKENMNSKELLAQAQRNGHSVTLQAIYKQIKALMEEEVVIKNKQHYIVSNEWRQSMVRLLDVQSVPLPNTDEKFTYKFTSLTHLDSYWKHLVQAIMYMSPEMAIFSYCPHQIWPYVPKRMESEKNIVRSHQESNTYNYFILGGNTELDKKYRRIFSKDFFKVELLPNTETKRHIHLTIIGNIIVSSYIHKNRAQSIDKVYASDVDTKEQVKQLIAILEQDQLCKIIIENNPKKAEIYRKRYSQAFAILK